MIAFFENVKFHREKRQIRRPFSETDFGDRFWRRFLAIFLPKNRQFLMVITFSWTDFGDVFLAIFLPKNRQVLMAITPNIAAYFS